MEFDFTEVSFNTATNIRTLVHWFKTWTSLQKELFLKDLTKKAVPHKVDLLLEGFSEMNVNNQRAPNIFECQLSMFGRWFTQWSIAERNFMLERLETVDPLFVEEFYSRIRNTSKMS